MKATINRDVTTNELLELVSLMQNQETTDKYTNTTMRIKGNNATIDVSIDDYGDVTLL